MNSKSLMGLGLAAFLLSTLSAGTAPADDPPKKPDPPGTGVYMNQLRAWFKAADLDNDGYLDKAELAKAFRGKDAKPYDFKKDGDKKDDAEKGKDSSQSTKGDKPDYSQYPDYVFLTHLDKDNDEKVSKDEFENWARDYAVQLRNLDDQIRKVARLEARLAAATTRTEIQNVDRELSAERDALNKLNRQEKAFDKALQKAMKKK